MEISQEKTLPLAKELMREFETEERGLTAASAAERLKKYGPNKLPEAKVDGIFVIFLRQFQSPLIYILIAASAAVFAMGEVVDGSVILAVLLFNAVVGTVQEGKAQNTLRALKNFAETKATVLRDGKELILPDNEVVPGDIIILQEGEKIPADARVLSSNSLSVDEASLTGESEPVHKIPIPPENASEEEVKSTLFKATNIVAGNGTAIVTATGEKTAIGKIASKIKELDTEIPLKSNIRHLSRLIIITVAFISISLFLIGILRGMPARDMFATVVSLAVSIVPEGLPIVVTLILAVGVWRMGKRKALVKKLQAVEALGQARVIAVDKTGTITKNELVVRKVYVNGSIFDIEGNGYEPKGNILLEERAVDAVNHPDLLLAGRVAARSASARVMYSEEEKRWRVSGDPTEAAMLVFAQKLGFHRDELERETPVVAEIAFDYRLKYHAVLHAETDGVTATVVGAPEVILDLSDSLWRDGKSHSLGQKERAELEATFAKMSEDGLRVIAFAERPKAPKELSPEMIGGLTFVGFYGMQDTLRTEAAEAVKKSVAAGIRVVMITGDHKITAVAIAKQAGIYKDGDNVLTGSDIDTLDEKSLAEKLASTSVFARVNPTHKLVIIKAFRARGEVVAMTGDGVNDAPSLVAADLGVAMGNIGTEVAKEAADIVLLDDNFENIISAVEEGRSIYKTIKKVILYLFAGSWGQILTITAAIILGYPLPLLAAQIIWLNFVTDGFLDVSLAMEPKENGLLTVKFERPKKYLISKLEVVRVAIMATTIMLGSLYIFSIHFEADIAKGWTMVLTTMAMFHWFNAWNCRSENKSIFQMNPFSNKFLVGTTITVIILQLAAVYAPFMNKFLKTTPLELADWFMIIPIAATIVLVEEARKWHARVFSPARA